MLLVLANSLVLTVSNYHTTTGYLRFDGLYVLISSCIFHSMSAFNSTLLFSQAGLRTLQDLAPEMRLAMEMEEGQEEVFEGDMIEEEEFFRVSCN